MYYIMWSSECMQWVIWERCFQQWEKTELKRQAQKLNILTVAF